MSKQILVNASHYETRVATLENGEIRQLHIEREEDRNVVGNIYKGLVKRVLPGMQAAFLELGLERTAFLYVDDIIDEPFGTDVEVMDDEGDFKRGTSGRGRGRGQEAGPATEEEYDEDRDEEFEEEFTESGTSSEADTREWGPEGPEGDDFDPNDEPERGFARERSGGRGDRGDRSNERPSSERPSSDRPSNERPSSERSSNERSSNERSNDRGARDRDRERPRDGGRDRESSASDRGRSDRDRGEWSERGRGTDKDRPERSDRDRGAERDRGERDRPERERAERDRPERDRPERSARGERGYRERGERVSRGPRERSDRGRGQDRETSERSGGERHSRGERSDRGERSERPEQHRDRGERQGSADRGERGQRVARSSDRDRNRRVNRPRRRFSHRRPRGSANIQDLLKEGQEILVQVAKAPIGTKGARLTTHISLPGRNLVLMPTVKHLGISRRIESDRERRRLRDMFVKKIRAKDVGFIIRTVAEGKSYRDLRADADYLLKLWAKVKRDSKRKRAPALIHEDLSLSMRAVRDFFTDEVDSFVIDNPEEYEQVVAFIGQFMPRLKSRVKLFRGPSQLFEHYGIEAEISRALGKKVWLKSGGYLLVDQSEALTAIDVNTGRYVGSKSLEETILKTNLEAVKEIAYQLRIRNVGGIIIIDLIDMESSENREKVYQALSESLGEDKAKTNILKISELGLVEMTRKRTHEDLVRYLTESCTYCEGRGYHKSKRTVCFEIFREIEKEALSSMKNIVVFASPQVVARMTKEEKEHVVKLQERFGKQIFIKTDPAFHIEQYEVFGKQ